MTTYQCRNCEEFFEIEEAEAILGHHEHYEHGMCKKCFDKSNEEGNDMCYYCDKVDKVAGMVPSAAGVFAHQLCIDQEESLSYGNPSARMRELGYVFINHNWVKEESL